MVDVEGLIGDAGRVDKGGGGAREVGEGIF